MLLRASLRHLLRHPWQAGLAVAGIALGVAVALAVDLASGSARRAFALFTESVAGRATHHVVGGPAGLPEGLYRRLRVELAVREAAPVVERTVAAPDHPGTTLHLMGVDPFAEAPFRALVAAEAAGSLEALGAFLTRPGAALLARDTAGRLGLRPGDGLDLRIGAERRRLVLVGLLEPRDRLSARALAALLVTDLATAQEVLGAPGRLDRIDLIVPAGAAGEALLARVRAALPPEARLVEAGARARAVAQMTRAFHLNLGALSLLALVVGMFLVYNTAAFAVVQRREQLGVLRALGVTRGEVMGLVLGEALATGLAATAVGVPLGIALGQGLVGLVARTINDLYVTLAVGGLALDPAALARAAALGLGGTVLAALAPACEATAAPPGAVLARSVLESRARRGAPRLAAAGAALVLAGGGLLTAGGASLGLAYAGLFAVVVGAALATPAATVVLMRTARPPLGAAFGTLGRLAAGAVVQALSRTGVALAALVVAVATTVGVGVMIGSFRVTVERWLAASLRSDVYVSAPSLLSGRPEATLDPDLRARLAAVPGVARVNALRVTRVEAPGGSLLLLALDADRRGWDGFILKAGGVAAARDGDAVLLSEPFAWRRGLGVGDRLILATGRGERAFPVAGVYHDYGSTEGLVLMARRTYDRWWDDPAVTSLGVHALPGADVDALVEALRGQVGAGQEVLVRSNRALREASLAVFDRTFRITVVLRWLVTLVAFLGVLSALAALVLERSRELGVLRAQGLTPGQVWGLVTAQTGLMGLVAGLLALPLGLALAMVLIFVVNQRSFGWTLQVVVDPWTLAQAVALAVGAALLAGLGPARRLARLALPAALRGE